VVGAGEFDLIEELVGDESVTPSGSTTSSSCSQP
jgi:hypothetical protein